jgi:anthranilate/para-aminobenzoate synthase component II
MRALAYKVLPRQTPYDVAAKEPLVGVFLSGGAEDLDVRDPLLFREISLDISCLVNCSVPVLGLCFGFEVIIDACGGEIVELDTKPPDHCVEVSVLVPGGIFEGLPSTICMREFNSQGTNTAPSTLTITASSNRSKVEAIQHRTRPIYGTQFHPEARDPEGNYRPGGLKIVNNFIDICLATVYSDQGSKI